VITATVADLAKDVEKYLREVERGESIEVRREDKPVAIVSPPKPSAKEYWKHRKPLPSSWRGLPH